VKNKKFLAIGGLIFTGLLITSFVNKKSFTGEMIPKIFYSSGTNFGFFDNEVTVTRYNPVVFAPMWTRTLGPNIEKMHLSITHNGVPLVTKTDSFQDSPSFPEEGGPVSVLVEFNPIVFTEERDYEFIIELHGDGELLDSRKFTVKVN
jgi:hypothetical protein